MRSHLSSVPYPQRVSRYSQLRCGIEIWVNELYLTKKRRLFCMVICMIRYFPKLNHIGPWPPCIWSGTWNSHSVMRLTFSNLPSSLSPNEKFQRAPRPKLVSHARSFLVRLLLLFRPLGNIIRTSSFPSSPPPLLSPP